MPKLTRKEIKLFCEAAAAGEYGIAQFGSLAAGTPVFSKDPDVIQALPAFRTGWNSAVVNEQSPTIEDRNALDYLLSYNQVYISQMGIPEWISTQTYYQGSVVTNGQESIYISLVDNNLNNPLTDDVYWAKFPTPSEMAALEAAKVNRAGDTMTGALYVPTPASTSNDTTVPTTSWVRNLLSGQAIITDYVTESNVSGQNWYRIYKSGWKEQGGMANPGGAIGALNNLNIPFSNTNYTIVATASGPGNPNPNKVAVHVSSTTQFLSTTGFGAEGHAALSFYWFACGY